MPLSEDRLAAIEETLRMPETRRALDLGEGSALVELNQINPALRLTPGELQEYLTFAVERLPL